MNKRNPLDLTMSVSPLLESVVSNDYSDIKVDISTDPNILASGVRAKSQAEIKSEVTIDLQECGKLSLSIPFDVKINKVDDIDIDEPNYDQPQSDFSNLIENSALNANENQISEDSEKSKGEEINLMTGSGNSSVFLPCKLCNTKFKTKSLLQSHMKKSHRNAKTTNNICKVCNKEYENPSQLNVHMRYHERPKDFICDMCGFAAIHRTALTVHQATHSREQRFKCDVCGQGFYFKCQLKMHMPQHTDERPYACKLCSKSWKTPASLKIHTSAQHPEPDGDKPSWECEVCGETFKLKLLLTKHRLSKHRAAELRNLCDHCGKAFTTANSLKVHKKSHVGEKTVKCDTCGKAFLDRKYLRQHARTHSGEKPYTCDHCGKSFSQQSSIVIHMRFHTGDRPYRCAICGRGFVTKNLLLLHQKNIHSVETIL